MKQSWVRIFAIFFLIAHTALLCFGQGISNRERLVVQMNRYLDQAVYSGNTGRLLEAEKQYEKALNFFIETSSLVDSSLGISERLDIPIEQVHWRAFMISGFSHYDAAQMHLFLQHDWQLVLHHLRLAERAFNDILKRELAVESEGGLPIPAPILSEIYYLIGNVFSFNGRIDSARNSYLNALRLNPRFLPARDSLAALDMYAGRYDHYMTSFGEPLPPCSSGQSFRDYYQQINIIIAPNARNDSIKIYQNFHSQHFRPEKKR